MNQKNGAKMMVKIQWKASLMASIAFTPSFYACQPNGKERPRLEAFYGRGLSGDGAPALEQAADEVPEELDDAAQQRDANEEIDDRLHNPWPSFH